MAFLHNALLTCVLVCVATSTTSFADENEGAPQFGFTEDTDVGNKGDRSVEFEAGLRAGKSAGTYLATAQLLSAKYTLLDNFRISPILMFDSHRISGVPGLDDRNQWAFGGTALEIRYRLLDREKAPIGLTLGLLPSWRRIDGASGERVDAYGSGFLLAVEKELLKDRLFAAWNLTYGLSSSRSHATDEWSRSSAAGTSAALAARVAPGFFAGFEARYERTYAGLGLDRWAGHVLYVGPNVTIQLSKDVVLSAAWNVQVAGRAVDEPGSLDLTNYERHQAKVKLGAAF